METRVRRRGFWAFPAMHCAIGCQKSGSLMKWRSASNRRSSVFRKTAEIAERLAERAEESLLNIRNTFLTTFNLLLACALSAQTLADRLGYPPGTKLIIVHADDLGETHAVNAAAIKALEGGTINSASVMVACPWFPEIADYARSHPEVDFGLH